MFPLASSAISQSRLFGSQGDTESFFYCNVKKYDQDNERLSTSKNNTHVCSFNYAKITLLQRLMSRGNTAFMKYSMQRNGSVQKLLTAEMDKEQFQQSVPVYRLFLKPVSK